MAVGVSLAVLAGYAALSLSRSGATQPPQPQRNVVVVARDVATRAVLVGDDLKVSQVPDVPSYASAFTDPTQLINQVTTVPLIAGQVVYPNMLITAAAGADFSILDPGEAVTADAPYWRAVSVMVPPERAVGGDILAGQHVDLYVTVQIDVLVKNADGDYVDQPTTDGDISGKSTKIVFEDLQVLKADADNQMYLLKVSADQAEQIYHVAAVSPNSFSLALRPDGDTRVATGDFGETNDRLIGTFGFPLPHLIEISNGVVGLPPGGPTASQPPVSSPDASPVASPSQPGASETPAQLPSATATPAP